MDIEAGIEFLKRDKNMQVLIEKFGRPNFKIGQDYFQSLFRSIVFQQLSGEAAQTIYKRLVNLITETSNLCPNEVLKLDKDDMRKAGSLLVSMEGCLGSGLGATSLAVIKRSGSSTTLTRTFRKVRI